MKLHLPQGAEVATHVYGPIANLVEFERQGWEEGRVPQSLLGPSRTAPLGLSAMSFPTTAAPDVLPLGAGLELTQARTEVAALVDRIAFVELDWRWTADEHAGLTSRQLADHWQAWYEPFASIEDRVLAATALEGEHSRWRFPLTVITTPEEDPDLDRVDAFALSAVGALGAPVRAPGFFGRISWDGAVLMTNRREAFGDQAAALIFLMRAICADWEFHQEVLQSTRRLLVESVDASANLDSVRRALRRIHTSLALVDPTALCYWDGHRQTVDATWQSWRRDDLNEDVMRRIDRVQQLYQFDVDSERQEMAAQEAVRVEILNRTVAWLGLLGVTATVAGVISTLDYDNATLDKLWRAVAMLASALLAVAAFATLVRRASRLPERHRRGS